MSIAIYSRKSKYTGKGESIENQVEMCRTYALTHLGSAELDFLYYEDEGFSGKSMERPQFQKLLRDARAHRLSATGLIASAAVLWIFPHWSNCSVHWELGLSASGNNLTPPLQWGVP